MRWQNGTKAAFIHGKRKCERETFGRKEEEAGQRENEKPQNRTGRRPAFEGQGERCRLGDGAGVLRGLAAACESSSRKGREGVPCEEAGQG